jgi:hypothetical protein
LNFTETLRLWPGFKLAGKVGPEYENCDSEEEIEEIVIPRRLSFVIVTVCDALVEPTDSLPKLTEEGFTFIFACAAVPKASKIVNVPATT